MRWAIKWLLPLLAAVLLLTPAAALAGPDGPDSPVSIVVDVRRKWLTVYGAGQPYKRYAVAVGRGGQWYSSPVGEWRIIKKDKNWGRGFGTRWLGLDVPWGIYGIHGTNKPWSIGQYASAGCIRMHNSDVEELYEWVAVGTPVTIEGPIPDVPVRVPMGLGASGRDVLLLQARLRARGYSVGRLNGRFGPETQAAVQQFQRSQRLPATGVVDKVLLQRLQLRSSARLSPKTGVRPT